MSELLKYRGKRVLVCGGREYSDAAKVAQFLSLLWPDTIIEGGAFGADRLAREWAKKYGVYYRTFQAEWSKYGKSAGPKRNQRMLEEGKPDVVLAFPGGRGTEDMITKAKAAGVDVISVKNLSS